MRHPVPADRLADIALVRADTSAGLDGAQVGERRARFGDNLIVEEPRDRWRELLRETVRDPMIWFLVGTGLLYALIGDRVAALVLLAAIAPLVGMDLYLHRRTRMSTQALRGRLASRVTAIRDGAASQIPAVELVPGDLIRLGAGELFPADGLIVRGEGLQIEESALTGESFPVRKAPLAGPVEPLVDAVHWGFAGTRLLTGEAHVRVVMTGAGTLYGGIVRSALAGRQARTPLQQAIDRLVFILVIASAVVCLALGVVRLLQGYGVVDALLSAVTLAVAAIPEEFPVVFAFFLGVGVYRLARLQALVRRAVAVEHIGRVSCLCADKTGTLTEGRLHLAHQLAAEGTGDAELLHLAALACREESGDPLDQALLQAARPAQAPAKRIALFPFTEERRRETAVYHVPGADVTTARVLAVVKGAPETVLDRCALDAARSAFWRERAAALAAEHKVIACASRELDATGPAPAEPDHGYNFAGLLAFEDPIRDGAAEAVRRAHEAGIRLIMVTGDHPANALAISREVGIGGGHPVVVLGEDLEQALREPGTGLLSRLDVVARALPAQKLMLVRALQEAGEIVAVTGDGVNDVPALKAADVGIAMGESATQGAREAGSIVLLDDNLRTIVNAVAEGRQLFLNLRLSFAYLLIVHLPLVGSAALVPLLGYPLLFLPIHIVWLELLIHPTAILAFQVAAGTRRRPHAARRQVRFFAARDWIAIGASGALVAAALLAGFSSTLASGGIGHARAMALVTLVLAGAACTAVLTGLATRAARAVCGLAVGTALLFTQWDPVAAVLGLQPLHARDWLFAAAAGVFGAAPAALLRWPAHRHAHPAQRQ